MKHSLKLMQFAGIPVFVHWSFGLLILWMLYTLARAGLGLNQLLLSVGFLVAIFTCVVLHEYGHALTARRFGVSTRDIVLTPIGGIARLERIPEQPHAELLVALAGPAVNLVLAALLIIYAELFTHYWVDFTSAQFWQFTYVQPFILVMAKLNIILAVFNMLPAFPMDGGRVLRSVLSFWVDRPIATKFAVVFGFALGLLMVLAWGLEITQGTALQISGIRLSGPFFGMIGLFVIVAARMELRSLNSTKRRQAVSIGTLAKRHLKELQVADVLPQDQSIDYAVFSGADFCGFLFHEHLRAGEFEAVEEACSGYYENLTSTMSMHAAIELFAQKGYRYCPVYTDSRFEGFLDRKDLKVV